jgi:glycosyltransferase involved in cell wall biosynthesis
MGEVMIRALHFSNAILPYDVVDTALTRFDRAKIDLLALTGLTMPPAGGYRVGEKYEVQTLGYKFERRNYTKMFLALTRKIRAFRPHVLHAHGFDENLIASLAVKVTHVPCYIIGRHYSDHIYFLTRGLKRKAYLAAEGFCNKTATRIAVPTEGVARILIDLQGVPGEKVTVIPFGVDFNRYRASSPDAPSRLRAEHGLEGKYLALTCGRLNPEKGLEYLLRAVPRVRTIDADFRLVVVGRGAREAELRGLCQGLGLEDVVRFVGWRDDAMDWIAAADLVVQPALCESWCQVLFEALGFAKPVIMTPVGAAPEVIGNNERGRLIPPRDSDAIAGAIIEFMNNREWGRSLAESGRNYIYRRMNADRAARNYEDLYCAALRQAS